MINNAILVFLATLALSIGLTFVVLKLTRRYGILKHPGYRRLHNKPTPTMGGIAIALATAGGILLSGLLLPDLFGEYRDRFIFLALASFVILVTGIIDDKWELSARAKIIGELVATTVLVMGGFRIETISNPFGESIELGWISYPLTYLWVLGLTNAINLSDGLDGFAAGIVVISTLSIALVSFIRGNDMIMIAMVVVAASALGFLFYNFPPAKIFMGDTGALFLGFILAGLTTMERIKGPVTVALVIPILALALPILDTLLAMLRRLVARSTISKGDTRHIHHRMLEMGLSPTYAILLAYATSALLGLAAISIYLVPKPFRLFILMGVGLIIIIFILILGGLKLVQKDRGAEDGGRQA
jgi:UDP-GlcNAc:undecaprenyl-phosphate/decaprenyl-phosphate GlcNAc-1-phosphate transferase